MPRDEALLQLATRCKELEFIGLVPGYALLVYWPEAGTNPVLGFRTTALDAESFKRAHDARARKEFEVARLVKSQASPYNDRVSVGRARNCDIVIRDASVSKLHAHFRVDEGARVVHVTDIASHNGTTVDGARLTPQEPCRVHPGSILQFGSVRAELADARALYAALR